MGKEVSFNAANMDIVYCVVQCHVPWYTMHAQSEALLDLPTSWGETVSTILSLAQEVIVFARQRNLKQEMSQPTPFLPSELLSASNLYQARWEVKRRHKRLHET